MIAVSILGIKDNLEKIHEVENSSTEYIHLDIMDGKFVSNEIDMRGIYTKPLDVHLMVENVEDYINKYKLLNPDYITFHYEAVEDPHEIIAYIHSLNIKAGISINPDTPVEVLLPYLDYVDLVLVMSVVPGEGGQEFIESSKDKIDTLYSLRENNEYNYLIEVDGGINNETLLLASNADMFVIGSYITKNSNYEETIQNIRQIISK